jgi:hypothetical protein
VSGRLPTAAIEATDSGTCRGQRLADSLRIAHRNKAELLRLPRLSTGNWQPFSFHAGTESALMASDRRAASPDPNVRGVSKSAADALSAQLETEPEPMPEPAATDLDLRLEFLEQKVEALERAMEKLAQQDPARESGLRRTLRSSSGLGLVRR